MRFLMYRRDGKSLEEFRRAVYTVIGKIEKHQTLNWLILATRIASTIEESKNGYITLLDVKYFVFSNCPHLVDEYIVSNIVERTNELRFVDPYTVTLLSDDKLFDKSSRYQLAEYAANELSDSGYAQFSRCSIQDLSSSSGYDRETIESTEKKVWFMIIANVIIKFFQGNAGRNQNQHLFDNIPG